MDELQQDIERIDALIDAIDYPFGAYEREAWQRLKLRLTADARDAARYRWLRDEAPAGIGEMAEVRHSHSPSEIDAAIDAAMLAAAKGAGRE